MKKYILGLCFCFSVTGCGIAENTEDLQTRIFNLEKETNSLEAQVASLRNENQKLVLQTKEKISSSPGKQDRSVSKTLSVHCPTGETEKEGQCVCAPGFTRSADNTRCINIKELENRPAIKIAEKVSETMVQNAQKEPIFEITAPAGRKRMPAATSKKQKDSEALISTESFFEDQNTKLSSKTTEKSFAKIRKLGCQKDEALKDLYAEASKNDFYQCDFEVEFLAEDTLWIELNDSFVRYQIPGGFEKSVDMPVLFEGMENQTLLSGESGDIKSGQIWIEIPPVEDLAPLNLEHIFFIKNQDQIIDNVKVL